MRPLLFAALSTIVPVHAQGEETPAENLARSATVSGPGREARAAVDGVKQQSGAGEWVGGSPNSWFGWIDYPKNLELKWTTPQQINKVVLYDRPTLEEHMAACVLTFSDGSKVHVYAVPDDGSAKTVIFEPRTVTAMRLDVVDGVGEHIGLSELEVYHDPMAERDLDRSKDYTDYVSYVDPTIETGRGRWFFCTPGSRPFGMVCASAYTRNKNQGGGGYNYNSTAILGFAQIHAWIMSGVNIMPTTGEIHPGFGEEGWKSSFSHESEIIEPGYHKLFLDRYNTQVEYTSTDRTALYRLSYREAARANLLLQLGGFVGAAGYVDGRARLVNPARIEGSHGMTDRLWGGPKLSHVFYVIELDRPVIRMDGWKGVEKKLVDIQEFSNPVAEGRIPTGYYRSTEKYLFKNLPEEQAGVSLVYDVAAGDEVNVKIGISYTSIENARKNLEAECAHWDFDRVRKQARDEWNEWLGRIDVKGGEVNTKVKFYTDLWHVLLGRHKIDDVNGDYPTYMGQADDRGVIPLAVKRVPLDDAGKPSFHMYNSDAFWLTQWNLNIVWGLGWPELLDEFSACLVEYARTGGRLPRGPCAGGYTGIMTGCPATSLITATWQKGLLKKVDEEQAYQAMRRSHPRLIQDRGPGTMVQGAFEYWALTQMAEELGHAEDLPHYRPWIDRWKKYFDPEKNLLSGRWVEANDWQGTFGVSHDIVGLARLMGGPDALAEKLSEAFEDERDSDFVYTYGAGKVSYANQPGCSNAHVFNHAGFPWLSQYWVRRVSRQAYGGTNPNVGYGGHDEDQGQMGGVSALMKLGLFSLRGTCSKEPIYEITTPEFDEVTIKLDPRYYSGSEFKITTHENTPENVFIQRAELDGKPLNNCWIYHDDLAQGGLLELWLGPRPNENWGRSPVNLAAQAPRDIRREEPNLVWQIGRADNSASEFALAPSDYARFLEKDFGWEDRYFLIGHSKATSDWPYVLPGPSDTWAGTGGTSGRRTHFLTILFGLDAPLPSGDWKLVVDLLDTHPLDPPLLKITVNGNAANHALPRGGTDGSIRGQGIASAREHIIEVPIAASSIRVGGNEIGLHTLDGSWLLFDQVRLEGPAGAVMAPVGDVFLRSARPAKYAIVDDGAKAQPLLVDVQHLAGTPRLSVRLDGKPIFSENVEQSRYTFEVPMPAVSAPTTSRYEVLASGRIIATGQVHRSPQRTITPADYVDTRMGTAHSRWMIAPGPWMPFSMVKLSPDNQNPGWQAGYEPSFENIAGFSHIHEWTMAGVSMMPTAGPLQIREGEEDDPDSGYRSRLNKATEQAPIGYYSADLTDYGITAELTSTTRCGFHRYTFPKDKDSRVLIDLHFGTEYRLDLREAEIRKVGNHRIEGLSTYHSVCWGRDGVQDYTVHFAIEFDRPIKAFGVWHDGKVEPGTSRLRTQAVEDAGAYAEFDTRDHAVVQAGVGISLVSIENAALNLKTEVSDRFDWSFDAVRAHHVQAWNDLFGRIEIQTRDRREKVRFYNNLYRSFCRNTWSDVNGQWVDGTERVRQLPQGDLALGCDAFWNTFWNLNQLWNLMAPEWSGRWVRSQLAMYDALGWLAKGPAGMEYIPVMVAEHEIPLIVGAYQMGIRDFDAEKAFAAARKMQTTPAQRVGGCLAGNRDLQAYLEHKYVPYDKGRFSNTLEYAYDDWAVAQFALALGKKAEYEEFLERSTWWRNAIDPETGYARLRKSDGTFKEDFDFYRSGANEHYVEGNAWQLTFFVPQDVPGLAKAIGIDRFRQRLEWGFEESLKWRFNAPNDQYWDYPVIQGNQQSMHFAYLFNWVGRPWLTQKWSRAIVDRYYGNGLANAYLGDEDQGQMSAWFVMTAIGLFQTDGGCRAQPIYEIGSPLYERIVIDLGQRYGRGKKFTIEARHASRRNKYVQSAALNGKKLETSWFPASELLEGGKLVLEMGSEPKRDWAAGIETDRSVAAPDLAQRILQDERMDAVMRMGHELLKSGMNAGSGYSEVWIRDLNTFLVPLLDVAPRESVRDALLTFFHFQGADGNIIDGYVPKDKGHVGYKYRYAATKPGLKAHKNTVETDQESSLVQAVCRYIRKTGDSAILEEVVRGIPVRERLEMALEYPLKHRFSEKYGLVFGATTADWGDVQPEHSWGVELDENSHLAIDIYDNALLLVAIGEYLETVCADEDERERRWTGIRDGLRKATREHLWDQAAKKFIPHVYLNGSPFPVDFDESKVFYHGGTAVAIEAGLLHRAEITETHQKMRENVRRAGAATLGLTVYPPYPEGSFKNRAMGPYSYQNGGDWTWFGARMVRQLARNGFVEESYRELEPMLDRVLEHGGFFEWWTPNNAPKGSGKFRGSAGVLIEAIDELRHWAQKQAE